MRKASAVWLGLILCITLLPGVAVAHQPWIVEPGSGMVTVPEPEISKAYYGELRGAPQSFEVRSDKPFVLYVNILVPKMAGVRTNISAEIRDSEKGLLAKLDGPAFHWTPFHEPFGGDDYLMGPEFRQEAPAGTYVIQVFSPDNRGKYVLAVGEKEEFPLGEIVRTLGVLPRLKREFFEESPATIVFSYTGASLVILLLIVAAIIYLLMRWFRRRAARIKS
jgi:hypothetical protein